MLDYKQVDPNQNLITRLSIEILRRKMQGILLSYNRILRIHERFNKKLTIKVFVGDCLPNVDENSAFV